MLLYADLNKLPAVDAFNALRAADEYAEHNVDDDGNYQIESIIFQHPPTNASELRACIELLDKLVPTSEQVWGDKVFQGRCYEGYMGVICADTESYLWNVLTHFLGESLTTEQHRAELTKICDVFVEAELMTDEQKQQTLSDLSA